VVIAHCFILARMDIVTLGAVLARAAGLHAGHLQALLAAAGGRIELVMESRTLARVEMPARARALLHLPDESTLRRDLRWLQTSGARLLLSSEAEYPPRLLATACAPVVLFVLGDVRVLRAPQIAMVGSRDPTPAGRRTAREFAAGFASAGLAVSSGLAAGIDAESHAGALRAGGHSVAVCGAGLDRIYPTQHRTLAARIAARGALVSEFPPGTPPLARNFPRRNRIISGLTLGTLVVEAARRSGSLITARLAAEQGREVFAVPGSIYNARSQGCHKLIRDGAALVESPAEVLQGLKIPLAQGVLASGCGPDASPAAASRARGATLDKEYEMLLDAVDFEPATVDVIALRTGLPGESITSKLLVLELDGRIAPYPGGRYGRISR